MEFKNVILSDVELRELEKVLLPQINKYCKCAILDCENENSFIDSDDGETSHLIECYDKNEVILQRVAFRIGKDCYSLHFMYFEQILNENQIEETHIINL